VSNVYDGHDDAGVVNGESHQAMTTSDRIAGGPSRHRPTADVPIGPLTTRSPDSSRRRLGLRWIGLVLAVVLVAGVLVAIVASAIPGRAPRTECRVTVGRTAYVLDFEQAANATTIAAVGERRGLPDHAVTVALAAALQESGLHNLDHGDRDSLGLFQQRPSQGWGTATDIMNPRYAADAFYGRLSQVANWQALAVTDAAQAVQRSADGNAYAKWEGQARILAMALTGQSGDALACRYPVPATAGPGPALSSAMADELGAPSTDVPVSAARGWTVAMWLVGHARNYGVASVAFSGRRWSAKSGTWRSDPSADATVRFG
jgi:hypothetical protein